MGGAGCGRGGGGGVGGGGGGGGAPEGGNKYWTETSQSGDIRPCDATW